MENIPKTISFRTDEETIEKMMQLKKRVFDEPDISNSEIIRYAIDYLTNNYGSGMANSELFFDLVKSYIKVTFLNAPRVNFEMLDEVLYAFEKVYEEYDNEEIEELGKLYDEEKSITMAQLIRFKYTSVPLTFLRVMGEDIELLEEYSDDDLANFLLQKFSEDKFKKDAKRLFHIEC